MKKENNKPNLLAWNFYTFCSRVMLKFKNNLKVDRKVFKMRNKKEGCLVIYNHQSNQDHFVTTASLKYTRTNYVITKHFYFNKTLRKVLTLVKAIPREQFKSDLISIRKMKKAVDAGGVVAIAPAGQITIDGQMPYIDQAITKLVKFCKVDVYAIQMYGTYLACPKWKKNKRRYPIKAKFVKVLTKEEINTLSDDEIYQKVVDSININDLNYQKEVMKKIKGKGLIEGLERIIYYCPKCKSTHSFISSGNTMVCCECGNRVVMNQYGFLEKGTKSSIIFDNEHLWYNAEKELIKKQIIDGTLYLEGGFKVYKAVKNEFELEDMGCGKVILTPQQFYYEGTFNKEKVKIDFDLDTIFQLPFDINGRLDVPTSEGTYQFRVSDNYTHVIEYVQAIDVLRELRK